MVIPCVLVVALIVQVVVIRSNGLEIDGNVIRISRWRSRVEVDGERCHLRFVNVNDFGKVMSPALEIRDDRGNVERTITLSEIQFVDDPLYFNDEMFFATNRPAIDMYRRVAQVVAEADEPRRWMQRGGR